MGSKLNKAAYLARVGGLVAGTQKHPPEGSVTIGGRAFTSDSLVAELQTVSDAMTAVERAKAALQEALGKSQATIATVGPLVSSYRQWVVATYGGAPAMLADFGIEPPKARTPLTTEERTVAIARSQATRAARHTLGAKQKKAVKGTVTTILAPPASGAAIAPAPGAAPSAAATSRTA